MRIAIDASLASQRGTGTGRYAALFLQHLLALDEENDYALYFRRSDRERNPVRWGPRARVAVRVTDAPLTLLRLHINLPIRLGRDRVDLYHSLGFFLPLAWRGPMVVTIHDIHPVIQPQHWGWAGTRAAGLVLRAHIPVALRQARRIVTPSEYVKQTVCEAYGVAPERIVVAPHAVDPIFLTPPDPSALEAAARVIGPGPFFLYVGVLAPHKNLTGLVRALARLREGRGGEGARLLVVGEPVGHYRDRSLMPVIEELGLGSSVTLAGYVDDERLRALYHLATALVLPSFGEGFGLPVLEAMACGTPVVTSRVSALPETGGDAAVYVDPRDPDDIAAAMAGMLGDDERRAELAARGRARAAAFTWERSVARVLSAYREAS